MIEIENIPLEDWLKPLKPYQRNTIEQLVAKYGEEKAAEEWINARGPMQTVTFGGVAEDFNNKKNYWNRLRNEFDKFNINFTILNPFGFKQVISKPYIFTSNLAADKLKNRFKTFLRG